jgi:hypothetical protein
VVSSSPMRHRQELEVCVDTLVRTHTQFCNDGTNDEARVMFQKSLRDMVCRLTAHRLFPRWRCFLPVLEHE